MPRIRPALVLSLAVLLVTPLAAKKARAQSLRGSRSSVNKMYFHAVDHGYYFYKTSSGIKDAAREGRFVRLSSTSTFRVDGASFPYVRTETRTFVRRLAEQYRDACGERLVVTSGARPRSMRLANSVDRSVHPTGMAVDLRKPKTRRCGAWLRETLLYLEGAGVIEATEEFTPPHFHVAVFPTPYQRYVEGKHPSQKKLAAAEEEAEEAPAKKGPPVKLASNERSGSARDKVRRGDSLWGIARRHDVTVSRIKEANGLRSSRIRIGQMLLIPPE